MDMKHYGGTLSESKIRTLADIKIHVNTIKSKCGISDFSCAYRCMQGSSVLV